MEQSQIVPIDTIVVVGYTRAGKDSLINTIAGRSIANVGSNNMLSTTKRPEEYVVNMQGKDFLFINMPGFNDTNLDFTDKQLRTMIENYMIEKDSSH